MKKYRSETAQAVRAIRAKTGLSQAKFAEKYGIPKRTVESWESGDRKPPKYVISLLEAVIGEGE